MGLLDVLNQYQQPEHQQPMTRDPREILQDFDHVARNADPDEIGHGLEEAFNSDSTPPAEQMVGRLYEQSDDHTRAGLLNEILGSLGGGALGGLLQRIGQGNRVSPEDARGVSPGDVEAATAQAARQNPNVIQAISRFYARHPQLVQTLGQAALGVLMSGMARRRRGV